MFASPDDFNDQLAQWLPRANARTVRSLQARPVDLLHTDYQSMTVLPPIAPQVGLRHRIRLGRDYYVRVDTVDYSVHPRVIGRFVDVVASLREVTVTCEGELVAAHPRSWSRHRVVTDPQHAEAAATLRQAFAEGRRRQASTRRHADGHTVELRALPDYDALFGVDFAPAPTQKASTQ